MTMPTDLVFHSIAQSNIPKPEKNSLMRLVDNLTRGSLSKYEERNIEGKIVHKGHWHSALSLARQDSEAFMYGGMIGAASPEGGAAAPAIAAIAGGLVAVLSSGTWMETSAKNLSATGVGILGYQTGQNFIREKRLLAGGAVHGESSGDPIQDWAKKNL